MSEGVTLQDLTYEQVAGMIDHALLKPEMTEAEVIDGCGLARFYHVASVCVKPCDVALAVDVLAGSDVKVGTVVGFPHGSSATETKVYEARLAIEQGAEELDMVINIGRLCSGNREYVLRDVQAVVEVARGRALVKVILENAYLGEVEKVLACQLAEQAGAQFMKTSTGFAPAGATVEDLRLMRQSVSPHIEVKAAHGIRTLDQLLMMVNAGATRIGTSATRPILEEFKARRGS